MEKINGGGLEERAKSARWQRRADAISDFLDGKPFSSMGHLAANKESGSMWQRMGVDQDGRPTWVNRIDGQASLAAATGRLNALQFGLNVIVHLAQSNDRKELFRRLLSEMKRRRAERAKEETHAQERPVVGGIGLTYSDRPLSGLLTGEDERFDVHKRRMRNLFGEDPSEPTINTHVPGVAPKAPEATAAKFTDTPAQSSDKGHGKQPDPQSSVPQEEPVILKFGGASNGDKPSVILEPFVPKDSLPPDHEIIDAEIVLDKDPVAELIFGAADSSMSHNGGTRHEKDGKGSGVDFDVDGEIVSLDDPDLGDEGYDLIR